MAGHEITTILGGSRGVPALLIREPGWQQQAADEREAQRRDEIKAEVGRIERERVIRESAPRPPLEPADPVERIHAEHKREEWLAEAKAAREWTPARVAAELDTQETLLTAMLALMPEPPPQPERYGKALSPAEVAYEEQQAAWQARQAAAAGCGFCLACRTGGVYPCVNR